MQTETLSQRSQAGLLPLAALAGLQTAGALVGRRYSPTPDHPLTMAWYRQLDKPAFTPPDKVFGIVWPALYALNVASGYRVYRAPKSAERTKALALWGVNLGLNALWSRLFYRDRSPKSALVDIAGICGASVAYAAVARKVDRPSAYLVAPLIGWVGFATALNAAIVKREDA